MFIERRTTQVSGPRPNKKKGGGGGGGRSRNQESRDELWDSGIRRRGMRRVPSRSTRLSGIRRFLRLFITWELKIEIQISVCVDGLPLKSEPPRSPLSTSLVPQLSDNLIPLGNHAVSLMEFCAQSTTLLA